jgi:hypothetical protein
MIDGGMTVHFFQIGNFAIYLPTITEDYGAASNVLLNQWQQSFGCSILHRHGKKSPCVRISIR